MEKNDKYLEFISVEFDDLNERYGKIEGVNILSNLVGDKWRVKEHIVLELIKHADNLKNDTQIVSKDETIDKSDEYFLDLIEKLSAELSRRGHDDDATNVDMLAALVDERLHLTNEGIIHKIREHRTKEFLKLGVYKTNAKELSLAVEKLVLHLNA